MSCIIFLLLWAVSTVLVLLGLYAASHYDPQEDEHRGYAPGTKDHEDVDMLFLDAVNPGDRRRDHGDDVYGYGFYTGEYR